MGNFVRGLTLSVSGFLGMWLCLSYVSAAYNPFLVPAGLASVFLGLVGFVLMISGMNKAIETSAPQTSRNESGIDMDRDRVHISDAMPVRLDEPMAKI